MPNPAPPPEDEHTTHLLSFYLHFCFLIMIYYFFYIECKNVQKLNVSFYFCTVMYFSIVPDQWIIIIIKKKKEKQTADSCTENTGTLFTD